MSDYLDELDLTVSTIWREDSISCPHRDILQAYLDGSLDAESRGYLEFHVKEIGCPYCRANLGDLEASAADDESLRKQEQEDRLLRSTQAFLEKQPPASR